MPKLNFKGVVTTCAVSLFVVPSVNAQQLSSVSAGNMRGIAPLTLPGFDLRAGALDTFGTRDIDAEIEEMARSKLPNFARIDMLRLTRQQQKEMSTNLNPLSNIAVHNRDRDLELETAPQPNTRPQYSVKAIQGSKPVRFGPEVRLPRFNRNMVKKDLDNACKRNGNAQNCTETFEAAAFVVAINDPNKGGAAEWTGRKAKEVSDDLVKLGGTQEQLMDVIKTSTDNVKYIEQSLPAGTRIDGPKEAAALNLVKTSLNLMKLKPATRTVIDDPAGCGSAGCFDPPEIAAMSLVRRLGSPAINRLVIIPVMHKYEKQVEQLGIDSGLDLRKSTGSVSRNTETDSVVALQGIVAATSVAVQAATQGYEESKTKEANRQNDAPTTIQQVVPQVQVQQEQVVQQQQQQQQQQNCNPQFQDC
jgi:hypothetical protein